MHKGRLFVLSGPSGTGKGAICERLVQKENIHLSVSMTTRAPRAGEIHGESYYFVEEDEFLMRVDAGGFLEHASNFGHRYGTPREIVLEKLEQGRDVILEIDVQGAFQVRDNFPEGILIFILPPTLAELRRRIIGRGSETPEDIHRRLGKAFQEISCLDRYDYCVINEDLDDAVEQVAAIIGAEHCRVREDAGELVEKYKEEIECWNHPLT